MLSTGCGAQDFCMIIWCVGLMLFFARGFAMYPQKRIDGNALRGTPGTQASDPSVE